MRNKTIKKPLEKFIQAHQFDCLANGVKLRILMVKLENSYQNFDHQLPTQDFVNM